MHYDFSKMLQFFIRNDSFLLAAHSSPDGDALGSMIALGIVLQRRGKKVYYYNRDKVPFNLEFLPESNQIKHELPKSVSAGILVDCSEKNRASADLDKYEGIKEWACIDHHTVNNSLKTSVSIVDPNVAATGIIVYKLIDALNENITADIATCIYTAIVVDTGFFKYPNTTAETFHIAEKLVKAGAKPWLISKNIDESFPPSRLRLMGIVFSTLEMAFDDRYSSITVTQKDLKKTGSSIEDTDEFAVFPRSIAGVEVSALFRQLDETRVKVSLRSKDKIDVASIALRFGGGGHKRAAGCLLENMSLNEAKKEILNAVEETL